MRLVAASSAILSSSKLGGDVAAHDFQWRVENDRFAAVGTHLDNWPMRPESSDARDRLERPVSNLEIRRPAIVADYPFSTSDLWSVSRPTASRSLAGPATAARPSEALDARWDQIDLHKKLWMNPVSKAGNLLPVPLSP